MKSKIFILRLATTLYFLLFFLFVFSSSFVFAASGRFTIGTDKEEVPAGEHFSVSVLFKSGGERINALEGELIFPHDSLRLVSISDGNSAINLWVEKPRLVSDGVIGFSGITPGGLDGSKNKAIKIFSIIFEAKKLVSFMLIFKMSTLFKTTALAQRQKLLLLGR